MTSFNTAFTSDSIEVDDFKEDKVNLNVKQKLAKMSKTQSNIELPTVVEFNEDGSKKKTLKDLSITELKMKLHQLGIEEELSIKEKLVVRYYTRTEFCFTSKCFIRKWVIYFIENKWFDRVILCLIMLNVVFLSLYDPTGQNVVLNNVLEVGEIVFQVIFSIEMCLKIFGMGFVRGSYSYMRDIWNVMDFFIVLFGFVGVINLFLPDAYAANLSTLRAVRVLRPLRSISQIPQMRIIVNSLFKSIKMLTNTLILYLFFLALFAIVGVQLFKGNFRRRCANYGYNETVYFEPLKDIPILQNNISISQNHLENPFLCGKAFGSQICPNNYTCVEDFSIPNPYAGFYSFDHFPSALLTLFTSISMEGWIDVFYLTWAATNVVVAISFFVLVVVVGNYFVVNLTLVIIAEAYNQNSKIELENEKIKSIIKKKLLKGGMGEGLSLEEKVIQIVKFIFISLPLSLEKKFLQLLPKWIMKTRMFIKNIVKHWTFNTIFIILTLANTGTMSIDTPKMQEIASFDEVMKIINYVFIGLFTFESFIKLVALSLKEFFRDYFNVFDLFIIVVSWIELVYYWINGDGSGTSVFSILRSFRLLRGLRALRIFRLIKASSGIQKLLKVVVKSLVSAVYLTILLSIIVLIAALLGMRFFGGGGQDIEFPLVRQSYDTFVDSLLTSFQIISGENWNVIMYKFMFNHSIFYIIYFLALYVIGNYGILNLFIAVLFEQFQVQSEKNDEQKEDEKDRKKFRLVLEKIQFWKRKKKRKINPLKPHFDDIKNEPKYIRVQRKPIEVFPKVFGNPDELVSPKITSNCGEIIIVNPKVIEYEKSKLKLETKKVKKKKGFLNSFFFFFWNRFVGDYALFIIPNGWFRKFLIFIVSNKVTELFLMGLILAATVTLALEDPYNPPDSVSSVTIYYINIVLTVIFTIECIIKVMGMGFVFGKNTYLRDYWNVLDFIIVLVGLYGLVDMNDEFSDLFFLRMLKTLKILRSLKFLRTLKVFRTFRIMRTLRPLRFLNKLEALKIIVDCLVGSIPNIISVIFLSLLIFVIFGIMGVQLFGGKFNSCTINKYQYGQVQCINMGGKWEQSILNFDNILNAMVTLFSLSTLEGWDLVMYTAIDVNDVTGGPPIRNNHLEYSLFFVIFVIVGAFFLKNLFVGVLIDKYHEIYRKKGTILLSKIQQNWIDMQRIILSNKPEEKTKIPKNKVRRFMFIIIESAIFEWIIQLCIMANSVVMGLEWYGASAEIVLVFTVINNLFTFIFAFEAILKIVVFGVREYFNDWWNIFDFSIVCVSIVTFVTTYLSIFSSDLLNDTLSFASVFRLLRIVRLFRLIKIAKGLRTLMLTFFFSIPALLNVIILLFIFFFMIAMLGMKIFGKLEYKTYLNSYNNFSTVFSSMITLFRISTGESWPLIMTECMDYLDTDIWNAIFQEKELLDWRCRKLDSCGVVYAPLFFVFFIVCGMFVLSNLFIAVIMQSFNFIIQQQESPVNENSLNKFLKNWMKHDPNLSLYMEKSKLSMFLTNLDPPLGVPKSISNEKMNKLINSLSLAEYDGKIHYHDVLLQLTKKRFGVDLPKKVQKKYDKSWNKIIPDTFMKVDIGQIIAAIRIKQMWRRKVQRRKALEALLPKTETRNYKQKEGFWIEKINHDDIDSYCESDFVFTDGSDAETQRLINEKEDIDDEDVVNDSDEDDDSDDSDDDEKSSISVELEAFDNFDHSSGISENDFQEERERMKEKSFEEKCLEEYNGHLYETDSNSSNEHEDVNGF